MRNVFTILVAVTLIGCAPPSHTDLAYASRYRAWRASVATELAAGRSWVYGDREQLDYLAAHAADHTAFLRHELESDMFCVLVLDASPLRAHALSESEGLQSRQQAWLKVLK